jgi:hypothetical protein
MNHECPHCYVNLKQQGTRTRLVVVGQHKGFYPCCPYCKTVLDLNVSAVAGGVGMGSLISLVLVVGQSVHWFESLGYAYKDAFLFSVLLTIVLSFAMLKVWRRMVPSHWMIWRKIARPDYRHQPDVP